MYDVLHEVVSEELQSFTHRVEGVVIMEVAMHRTAAAVQLLTALLSLVRLLFLALFHCLLCFGLCCFLVSLCGSFLLFAS